MFAGNRIAVLFLLPLLAAVPGVAVAGRPPVRVYTAADGLAAYAVFGVLADSRGFLWFRTNDGLSRFDGYAFTTYTTDDGLPDRRVSDIVETRSGDYWVATEGGLCRFDPRGVRGSADSPPFVRVRVGGGDTPEKVYDLVEARDGVLWCGTSSGLYRLGSRDGRFVSTRVDLGTTADVLSIIEDRQGAMCVGTLEAGGLYRVGPAGAERQALPEFSTTYEPETLFEDREGRLWLGSRAGLCYADPSTAGDARRVFVEPGPDASRLWATSFYETNDGTLLVGTTTGLWRVTTGAGRPAFERIPSLDDVCKAEVWGIAEDRDGNLWLATRCGAVRIGRPGFTEYTAADGLAPGTDSIFESRADELVVTANPGGRVVHRFDGATFTHVTPNLPRTGYDGWGWGQTILQDREGAWWVPTGTGVYRFPSADRPETALGARPETIYTGREVFRVFEDARGDVWFSTTRPPGLFRWERERGEVVEQTDAAGVSGVEYTAFAESGDGPVWIGTSEGLLRYADGRFAAFGAADGVPAGWIRDLHVDLAGHLWIASSLGGLGRVDDSGAERPRVRVYRKADGLSTDNVHCVTDDAFGRVYLGTEQGVDRLDPPTGRVKHFTSADGLPKGAVAICYRDRRGRLWFAAGFGLARLDPEPERPREPPRTLVTGLRVAGVARPVSALGESAIGALELGSDENSVSVDFLGLGASLGEELVYQYRIEGADADWSAPSRMRTVTFARLAPGSYHVLVRAVDADGRASREPAAVAFTIAAPVWQRRWFLALAVAAACATAYALYRYRIARLLEVERVRTRIATDLHDDIGSSLSQITVLTEVARRELDGAAGASARLAMIAEISRDLVDSVSDIVWAINPKRDSLGELANRMRRFASDVFTARGVEFSFRAPGREEENVPVGADLRREVFLVFKEAVNNAIRHSGCPHADVALGLADGHVELRVADDGRGFDTARESDGNGLASMRARAARVGGSTEIVSVPGEGTTVRMRAPLRRRGPHIVMWRRIRDTVVRSAEDR